MRIIDEWQYRYIEKCLYGYEKLKTSTLQTEQAMAVAIEKALEFFQGQPHEIMMIEFYFKANKHRKTLTNSGHYRWVCQEQLFLEEPSGYVIRREIIYKVAMFCYGLHIFQL